MQNIRVDMPNNSKLSTTKLLIAGNKKMCKEKNDHLASLMAVRLTSHHIKFTMV